jgi:hypothetical protein
MRNVERYLDFSVSPETLDQARKLPVIVEEDHQAALESASSWTTGWKELTRRFFEALAASQALYGEPGTAINLAASDMPARLHEQSEAQQRLAQNLELWRLPQWQPNRVTGSEQPTEEQVDAEEDDDDSEQG